MSSSVPTSNQSPTASVLPASPAAGGQMTAALVRDSYRQAITSAWLTDEGELVQRLLSAAMLPPVGRQAVIAQAADWVHRVRRLRDEQTPLDAFMQQYDLSSEEGVLLMCLAEALLRIPDDETAEKLIADKLADADWEKHLGRSDSLFVNAGTWGLMLTGRLVRISPETTGNFRSALNRMIGRSTEPVIRLAIRQAMRLMGQQFVMGRTIGEALKNTQSKALARYRQSFDMLGEAALTGADAERYLASYHAAIDAIGTHAGANSGVAEPAWVRPSISVKLSALHPRYEPAQRARVLRELPPALLGLALAAKKYNIGLTVDAEEADRLELSLDVFAAVYRDAALEGWEGFGLAVQAFQKRAFPVIEWLEQLFRTVGRRIPVRLVKGAYWDTEIKRAQEQGLTSYPVFTRKVNTDVAYLACARRLLTARDSFYPMFATHNAHTVAAVRAHADELHRAAEGSYEFQRLHGMGEALYRVVSEDLRAPCRVYAPVGSHEDLLPYLVRRLLENGANTSFVNRIYDDQVPPEQLVADPVATVASLSVKPNPDLPLPPRLFGDLRQNSAGVNFSDDATVAALSERLASCVNSYDAVSQLAAEVDGQHGEPRPVLNPADRRRVVGQWRPLAASSCAGAVEVARNAQRIWSHTPVDMRAMLLERAADQIEARAATFLHLLVYEAGKTLPDAHAELRETVDFLRYYALHARQLMVGPTELQGPTGEINTLSLHGRGVFVCISPWNFPLAIFAGQVAAALVTGNAVIAKPAEQTPLVAVQLVQLLYEAGVPRAVLQCILGEGDIGAALVADPRIAGVAFTGSVEVAQRINQTLAARRGPIAILIAETGGQNAMIADSSALPEQVVKDAISSAFNAAGQRCSAARILCVQDDIGDKIIAMLKGALRERVIGDPANLATDIGPVIDEEAQRRLVAHSERIVKIGKLIEQLPLTDACSHGTFVAPLAVQIESIAQLDAEHFGPILHVVRYPARKLESIVDELNATGYGLTLGVHSRIESTWRRIVNTANVGNIYINRNQIGAVVGVQPFGGEGLSGTGPKAGGPHYLLRFVTERTLSVNTSAVGGNARLLAGKG
jgi:RHH-type proline utilization regulon transcriptional repressor/proline dehydrogenase/delta 1-pyrroline-5-carboxylate dehydrogenase